MVIVKLSGGLGNQMFQYALGRRLSLNWDDKLAFDSSWFSNIKKGDTIRDLEISKFNIVVNEVVQSDIERARPNLFIKILNKIKGRFNRNIFYTFNRSLLKKRKDIFLDGYFQSYKYFESIRELLLKDFTLKNGYSEEVDKIKMEIEKAGQAVSIHVRRGDFATSCKDWHGLCSVDYYKKAFVEIKKKYPAVTLFVFSDDIGWAEENLKLDAQTIFASRPTLNAVEEMLLMSLCKHQIIANSTFSWWAAWLNENNKKIVVAPSRWLVASNINTNDLLPHDWIKI
jgi:hypothetical protein